MKILLTTAVFPPEPVVSAQISNDLAKAILESGNSVTVLAPVPSRPDGFNFKLTTQDGLDVFYENQIPGVKVVNLASITSPKYSLRGRIAESYSFGKEAARYISDNKGVYDKVYINSWPLFSQLFISKACQDSGIPYVIHIQDIYPESLSNKLPKLISSVLNNLLIPFEKYYLKKAADVIAISDSMKKHLVRTRNLDEARVNVIHNWQDESEFVNIEASNKSRQKKFTFTYLGNIGPVAGVETLINAFCKANLPDCKLVIAGNGASKSKCMMLASKYPNSDIQFIEVPVGAVAKVQKEADVLLLPVIKGGALSSIPSKLPAYMFSSKPILATLDFESDTAQAIVNAECGWVGPAQDVEWLAMKMKEISTIHKSALVEMGMNGYNYGIANFSKKINLKKLMNQVLETTIC